ncbi:hypothetical protein BC937DRAFT_94225 [Endogone sp. FLAS-F59071]|nr:hypothetical protein BC937DRAFT_94225 [Endogone sp. FLAS-F59071]|eukprot:RUS14178.1 hypothetical protein BC937DRAFT_94225 [Endogone sp. FLAS-F59071]
MVVAMDLESGPEGEVATYSPAAFKTFQYNYLLVYLIIMTSDWLQGPYLYKLYQSYGYEMFDIAFLFMTGFVSSAIFGTVMGGVADSWGRKRMCLIFCLTSSLACLVRLNSEFYILFISHLLSGLSGGLLNCVFEAWYVAEHQKRGFPPALMSITFSISVFLNGLVAILSGVIANKAVEVAGFKAPFLVSVLFLVLAAGVMSSMWTENYGDGSGEKVQSVIQTLFIGWETLKNGKCIQPMVYFRHQYSCSRDGPDSVRIVHVHFCPALYTGSGKVAHIRRWQSLISQLTFYFSIFLDEGDSVPLGYLFSTLMVAVMLGSLSFRFLLSSVRRKWKEDKILIAALGIAGVSFWGIALRSGSTQVLLVCYHLFEFTTGLYFPSVASLRAETIPETSRAAVMALLRVPMNVAVCAILWQVDTLSISTLFAICAALTFLGAAVVSLRFVKHV